MTVYSVPNKRKMSHREEVAAFGDPRAIGDSTLNPAYRDAFPLRVLQASQPTGDGMSDTTFYLRSRFVTTSRESIPRELRSALVEIQSKTALVTSKSAEDPTL
ncbi:hypothetical protein V1478_010888 [Vespula squamosa]|uniref:Uncharacterized protein n=1 Tax=Vespula squamosa TaxID=30214 RepID=A0ABD2AFM4_VESSQ